MAKYFTDEEIAKLDPLLVERLDWAREQAGIPFVITSGFREGDDKAHGRGMAVDIRCRQSQSRIKMVQALLNVGFRRVGVYDKHVHADVDPALPENVMWWGVSD